MLGGIADISRPDASAVVSQYDIQPMVQIYATTQGRDLGAVAADVRTAIDDSAHGACRRVRAVVLLGQVKTMDSAFSGLLFGLLGAIVLIYLLIVVNFQSWTRSVRHHHRAARGAGRHRLDAVRHPHHAVGAGADRRHHVHGRGDRQQRAGHQLRARALGELGDPIAAALDAGFVRFRPVLMTALAMIIGMAPMALGLGEGGEQNAPLGRAVIGGLIFATIATLIFVPVVFSMVHKRRAQSLPPRPESRMPPEDASAGRRAGAAHRRRRGRRSPRPGRRHGHRARARWPMRALNEWTDNAGGADRRGGRAGRPRRRRHARSAGPAGSLFAGADLSRASAAT